MGEHAIVAPDMDEQERALFVVGHMEGYKGFQIVPKRDFGGRGFWSPEHRCSVNAGWVITDGFCNVMPGAVWAYTIQQAKKMADDLLLANHDASEFWALRRARTAGRLDA